MKPKKSSPVDSLNPDFFFFWLMNNSELMSYCSYAKKENRDLEDPLESIFWVSFSIIERILGLATPLEML